MASITKRDESFTVYEYDNGYMLECSGRDADDNWATSKVIYPNQKALIDGIMDLINLVKN